MGLAIAFTSRGGSPPAQLSQMVVRVIRVWELKNGLATVVAGAQIHRRLSVAVRHRRRRRNSQLQLNFKNSGGT